MPQDLIAVAEIQSASPDAAQWQVQDYLAYDWLVAEQENQVIGFAVSRRISGQESELLNLAVHPQFRRRGVATLLLQAIVNRFGGSLFVEVRESNAAARVFYQAMRFQELGRREDYYTQPAESAIVMKFHS